MNPFHQGALLGYLFFSEQQAGSMLYNQCNNTGKSVWHLNLVAAFTGNIKPNKNEELTWYVPVTILKGMEVVHEFFYRDLKGLKQASVFKKPVRYLRHKKSIVRICEEETPIHSGWWWWTKQCTLTSLTVNLESPINPHKHTNSTDSESNWELLCWPSHRHAATNLITETGMILIMYHTDGMTLHFFLRHHLPNTILYSFTLYVTDRDVHSTGGVETNILNAIWGEQNASWSHLSKECRLHILRLCLNVLQSLNCGFVQRNNRLFTTYPQRVCVALCNIIIYILMHLRQ